MPSWNNTILLLCLLCAVLNTVQAQFGPWSSRGVRSVINRPPDAQFPHESERHSLHHTDLKGNSENNHDAQQSQSKQSGESLSSDSLRRTFESASETAQDIWRMLNPSYANISTDQPQRTDRPKHAEADPISVDEAIQHVAAIIRILSNTQKVLLAKKVENLPFPQRIMFKYFYSHRDPLPTPHKAQQKLKRLNILSNLANSARDFATISANPNVIKENINVVTATFAKELLLSVSALKDATRNAAHGGWLVTPQVRAYVHELTQNFGTQSEKWMQRIGKFADAAKPIADNMASKEDLQELMSDMEEMVMEFREEIWRMRTEWVYKKSETLSWATESLYAMKRLGRHELDRLSESVHIHGRRARHMLKAGLERNQAKFAYLQQHVAERFNHVIDLVLLWMDIIKGLLRIITEMLKSVIKKLWRVFAFIAVIVFFRCLLNLVQTNPSVRYFISGTFSRTNATNSPALDTRPTLHRGRQTTQPDSPPISEYSESKPTTKEPSADNDETSKASPRDAVAFHSTRRKGRQLSDDISHEVPSTEETSAENDAAPKVSKPSKVGGTASPSKDITVNSTAQHQVRRTPSRAAKTVRGARPLQVSNLDYPDFLSSLEKGAQPIHIGDHAVQMVYNDTPSDSLTDNSKNDVDGKKRSRGNKNPGIRRISRREEKKMAPERQTQVNDGDNVSGTSFESATSRQTRSSARRSSARRSHLR